MKQSGMRLLRELLCASISLILLGFIRPAVAAEAEVATYVGEKVCTTCHSQENKHFTETTHSKLFRLNPRNDKEALVCEACHGPGSLHAKNISDKSLLIGFTKYWGTPVAIQNGQCLSCHNGGSQMHWASSIHATQQLSCADCHNPMERNSVSGLLAKATINDTCETCHQQQKHDFDKRSHMPLHEGKISCVDCHNPHGSATRPLLKAESTNAVCYSCHAEKRGPFLWEHAPVRENCLNCHAVHGSNHDKLLVSERPFLCQQCHNLSVGHSGAFYRADQTAAAGQLPGGATNQRLPGRACQNCHTQIHGSNHPAGARFQR